MTSQGGREGRHRRRRATIPSRPVRSPSRARDLRLAKNTTVVAYVTLYHVRSSRTAWLVLSITGLALLPRLLTAGRFVTFDEDLWMRRAVRFGDAVTSGEFAGASASTRTTAETMPGVTTMWIGSLANGLWNAGHTLGLWETADTAFLTSQSGFVLAQGTMAGVTSALIGLVAFLVARWAGLTAAVVAGVLLATEPFVVAHGAVLHTDGILAMFGVAALIATALALGLPAPTPWAGRPWAAAIAGALWGAAFLTKLSALNLLPGVVALGAWASIAAYRDRHRPHDADQLPARTSSTPSAVWRVVGWWAVGAFVIVVAAYPALWVQPVKQVSMLWESAGLATGGHRQFFLGESTRDPGPAYYMIALPLRISPWFLIAGAAAGVAVFVHRPTRTFGFTLLCMALPPFVVLSLASKKFDRYGLQILVVAAIAIGVIASSTVERFRRDPQQHWRLRVGGTAIATLLAAHAVAVAPWGLAYFNPVLGGAATAEQTILIGWGEGLEQAGSIIEERAPVPCDEVSIWSYDVSRAFPCGNLRLGSRTDWTFVVVYVNHRQRETEELLAERIGGRMLVGEVTIRGITYAEIYVTTE